MGSDREKVKVTENRLKPNLQEAGAGGQGEEGNILPARPLLPPHVQQPGLRSSNRYPSHGANTTTVLELILVSFFIHSMPPTSSYRGVLSRTANGWSGPRPVITWPFYTRASPGHLVAFTPASASTRSLLASLVSTSPAPRAASTSASRPATGLDQIHHTWSPQAPASFPAVQHPYTYTVCPLSWGPLGALHLSSAIKPMSNTGYRSNSPRIKHREQTNLHALGSSPTFIGSSPPHALCPAANHHLVSKHRKQLFMLQGKPLRLSWDNGPAQTAVRRSTDCAPNRHPSAREAINISSGASTLWQSDRRGIDRRHPGPMRRGPNSPAWSMGVQ